MKQFIKNVTKNLSWFWCDFVKDILLLACVITFIINYMKLGTLNTTLGSVVILILCIGMICRNIYSDMLD